MNLSKLTFCAFGALIMSFFTLSQAHDSQAHEHSHATLESAQASAHSTASTPSQKIISAMHGPMHANKPSQTKSVEIDFLSDMIPHHQGAIDSAKLLLESAKTPEIIALAENIIKAQEAEIAQFKELIDKKGVKTTKISSKDYKAFGEKNAKAMESMMEAMKIQESGNAERDFLSSMIGHHKGAIETSKVALEYSKDEVLRKIAQKIIDDQEAEITTMGNLIEAIDTAANAQAEQSSKNTKKKK